jgi:RNA polymerase sporulation-specific sigma factor
MGFLYALNRYDPSRQVPFAAYLKRCVSNALKNFAAMQYTQKMAAYRQNLSLDALEEEVPLSSSDEQNPEMLYLLKEQWDQLKDSIENKLSPLERDILALYLRGNNYKFIASKMGIPYKSVDNALQRVRRKLKASSRFESGAI